MKLVTAQTFNDSVSAHLVKTRLENEGIECYIFDENINNIMHLNYEKSIIMATYMLCGFANFASIGIQIGGIGSLAPGQRKTLSKFGMKALIGGSIASLISATIAGMIIG